MPYISEHMSKPLREGNYECLVDSDGFGTLVETSNNKFNGSDWDPFESHCQFITHWLASSEDYNTIFDRWEKDLEKIEVKNVELK